MKLNYILLFLILPLMIFLGVIESGLQLTREGHILAQIIILFIVYWLVNAWLNANEIAMIREEVKKHEQQNQKRKSRWTLEQAEDNGQNI